MPPQQPDGLLDRIDGGLDFRAHETELLEICRMSLGRSYAARM
jgi:hypothetical protein